jgi:hypothetical protein
VEPQEDHVVHLVPRWRQRGDEVVEDVVGESIPPKCENDLSLTTRVVGGRRVQHNGHEGSNVVNPDGLSVEGGVESGGGGGGSGAIGGSAKARPSAAAAAERPTRTTTSEGRAPATSQVEAPMAASRSEVHESSMA